MIAIRLKCYLKANLTITSVAQHFVYDVCKPSPDLLFGRTFNAYWEGLGVFLVNVFFFDAYIVGAVFAYEGFTERTFRPGRVVFIFLQFLTTSGALHTESLFYQY